MPLGLTSRWASLRLKKHHMEKQKSLIEAKQRIIDFQAESLEDMAAAPAEVACARPTDVEVVIMAVAITANSGNRRVFGYNILLALLKTELGR